MRRGNLGTQTKLREPRHVDVTRAPAELFRRSSADREASVGGRLNWRWEGDHNFTSRHEGTGVGAPVICNLRALRELRHTDGLQDRSISRRQPCVASHNRPRRAMIRRVIDEFQFRMRNIRAWISMKPNMTSNSCTLILNTYTHTETSALLTLVFLVTTSRNLRKLAAFSRNNNIPYIC